AQLRTVDLAIGDQGLEDALIHRSRVRDASGNRFHGGCMTPRKTRPLEVFSRVDPGLDHRAIGHHVAARRDHVTEGKALALEVAQRVDRGTRLGDEEAMELLVDVALTQWDDAEFLMCLHLTDCAEN